MLFRTTVRTRRGLRVRLIPLERLEPRYCLSATFDVSGVQAAALDQPQIHALFKSTASGAPLTASDGMGGTSFDVQAFLDTGTSGMLLSQETAQGLGIASSTYQGQTVTYADVGVGGAELFDVSTPVYTSLAPFIPTADVDNPATYTSVYNQNYGPVRTQINRTPADDLIGPLDILGMPLLQNKVMVMNPRPVENLENMYTWVYNPGTPFNAGAVDTNPGIPTTNRHVKLSYGNFTRFSQVTPTGAAGPNLNANPFIGPDPTRALLTNPPPDTTPPVQLTQGTHSTTGSFLFDTGAAASFISVNLANQLHVHYKAGTYNTDNPVLVDDNGTPLPNQFVIPLGGIGGTLNAAGFYADSLTLPTVEGQGIRFLKAPLLVADVSVQDPVTQQTLTLDGDFGMNFLVASADISTGFPTDITAGAFDWEVFDQPNGLLGLQVPGAASVFSLSFATGNNSVYVKRDADGTHADFWVNSATPGQGTPTQQTVISANDSYSLLGGTGNDALTVDFTNGNPFPAGGMSFDGGAGANGITFIGTAGNETVTASAGSLVFNGGSVANATVTAANLQSVRFKGGSGGTDALNVTGGSWQVDADTASGTPNVSVNVSAGATATFTSTQHLAALTVNGSAKLATTSQQTLSLGALTINTGGQLDLANNILLVSDAGTPSATVLAYLKQGYNFQSSIGVGLWDGAGGITSAYAYQSAHGNGQITMALVDGAVQTKYGINLNLGLSNTQTMVRPAYYGDVTLNGHVDGDDMSQIAQFALYNKPTAPDGWINGDLNYDGKVNGDDLSLIAQTKTFNGPTMTMNAPAAAPAASLTLSSLAAPATTTTTTSTKRTAATAPAPRPTPPHWSTGVRLKHLRRVPEITTPLLRQMMASPAIVTSVAEPKRRDRVWDRG